jgi:hypothetical protein
VLERALLISSDSLRKIIGPRYTTKIEMQMSIVRNTTFEISCKIFPINRVIKIAATIIRKLILNGNILNFT